MVASAIMNQKLQAVDESLHVGLLTTVEADSTHAGQN